MSWLFEPWGLVVGAALLLTVGAQLLRWLWPEQRSTEDHEA
jgi:hypothetical protein